jgi:hypothetical protein
MTRSHFANADVSELPPDPDEGRWFESTTAHLGSLIR